MSDEERGRAWLRERLGCSDLALDRLAWFVAALAEENRRQNLVAPASMSEVWWRHVVDSAQLLVVSRETKIENPWLDLGSGAGFPGAVIAILAPEREVHLVEVRRQRIAWLEYVTAGLGLTNAQVRGQSLGQLATQSAGVISARAFAPLPKLLRLAARFSTPETLWLLPKGKGARHEVNELPPKLRRMFHVEPSATSPSAGVVVGRGAVEARGVPVC